MGSDGLLPALHGEQGHTGGCDSVFIKSQSRGGSPLVSGLTSRGSPYHHVE